MRTRVALIPSNQNANAYAGVPGVTEETWAVAVCDQAKKRLQELGAEARIFHIAGSGPVSTDELALMLEAAVAWKPDYLLSVHSDAVGDKAQTGVLMLMARVDDAEKGQRLGRAIAARVGLPYKATWVYGLGARKIMYLSTLRTHGLQGALVEIGEHATAKEAAWNWTHMKEIGVGIADALADYLGLETTTEADDMTADEVRQIVREEIEAVYSADVERAQQVLVKEGIISKPRAASHAASIGYVDLIAARVLKLAKG